MNELLLVIFNEHGKQGQKIQEGCPFCEVLLSFYFFTDQEQLGLKINVENGYES